MIYALLSRNFGVQIYALFPQNILDWGADSTNFSSFWMYEDQKSKSNGVSLQSRLNPAGCALSSAINAMMDWLLSFQRLQCLSRMESCSKTRWVSIFTSGSNPQLSSSSDCESWFALVEISWLPPNQSFLIPQLHQEECFACPLQNTLVPTIITETWDSWF